MDYKGFNMKTTAVIAAVSESQGLVLQKDYGKSVNIESF